MEDILNISRGFAMQDFIAMRKAAQEQPLKSEFETFFKAASEDQRQVGQSSKVTTPF